LRLFACTIAWRNTPFCADQFFDKNSNFSHAFWGLLPGGIHLFVPNNFLTRIHTFHRHFEAYCLYNSIEKYEFFGAEQFFNNNSNFSQAFWGFLSGEIHLFVPNNSLTRIQTFHRHFEAFCLYNSMEKYTFLCQTIVWQELKLFPGILRLFACTIAWRNTRFLPNNCLTKIQTFHRHFEAYCMNNSTFFAEQLLDKNPTGILKHIGHMPYLCNIMETYAFYAEKLFENLAPDCLLRGAPSTNIWAYLNF
jgi:hypothetical protein